MSKKGDLFMVGLNVLFLVAIILVFWKLSTAFQQPNYEEGIGTRQTALLSTYALAEDMLTYIDTAATFAAYETFNTVAEKAITNPSLGKCGSYAGYERWSKPGGTCFLSKVELNENFEREFRRVLKRMWNYPGMPVDIVYAVSYVDGKLVGTTEDRITLPVVTAKGTTQREASRAILDKQAARVSKASFQPDSSHVSSVVVSPNKADRSGSISHVVVLATGTENAADAIYRLYGEEGTASVHYLVDEYGVVTQLVPEGLRAISLEICETETCTPPDVEDLSISVALVNSLEDATCSGDTAQCWDTYPPEQIEKLKELLADILGTLGPEDILLQGDVMSQGLGPAFMGAIGSRTSFLQEIGSLKSKAELGTVTAGTQEEEKPAMLVTWPTESRVITSCFGPRNIGDGYHDAIDMRGDGTDVYAFADGIVRSVCKQGDACPGRYGNNIILDHNGIFTRYNHLRTAKVRPKQRITRGEVIGTVGSTGATSVPHLDFKVYADENFGANVGKNPLCYMPAEDLQNAIFKTSCGYNVPLSPSDPKLAAECEGVTAFAQDKGGCFESVLSIGTEGSGTIKATRNRLDDLGLIDEIESASNSRGVDPNLVVAIIAKESSGRADILNGNAVGLGQFMPAATEDMVDVFKTPAIADCTCRSGVCTADEVPACAGDPRLDPVKAVNAIPGYLALQKKYLKEKGHTLDDIRFFIAAYNQGAREISKAINKAPAKNWEVVQAGVPEEGQDYVRSIMEFYEGSGGNSLQNDQECRDVSLTVRELGSYSFEPSFEVDVPNFISPAEGLMKWAQETYDTCLGETDNRACLAGRKTKPPAGVEFVSCSDVEQEGILPLRFSQFITDCSDNGQTDCTCTWHPTPLRDMDVQLYENVPSVTIDDVRLGDVPVGRAGAQYKRTPDKDASWAMLSLRVAGTGKQHVRWKPVALEEGAEAPFGEVDTTTTVDAFRLLKDDEGVSWVSDPDEIEACGVYKTQHHICAKFTEKTYTISTNEQKEPIVRLAMHLRDEHKPLPVDDVTAINEASLLDNFVPGLGTIGALFNPTKVTFSASSSDDVSYYTIECVVSTVSEGDTVRVLGREVTASGDTKKEGELSAEITCKAPPDVASIRVTPYDISGVKGDYVDEPIEKIETAVIEVLA